MTKNRRVLHTRELVYIYKWLNDGVMVCTLEWLCRCDRCWWVRCVDNGWLYSMIVGNVMWDVAMRYFAEHRQLWQIEQAAHTNASMSNLMIFAWTNAGLFTYITVAIYANILPLPNMYYSLKFSYSTSKHFKLINTPHVRWEVFPILICPNFEVHVP